MECKNESLSIIRIIKKHIMMPRYFLKKMGILLLCIVHEFTKYKTCRNFSDLFYWPDGFCADTVVIIAFFALAGWCVWEDLRIMADIKSNV